MTNRIVALYARVSTDMQQNGLEAQLRSLEDYCKSMGIVDYKVFSDFNQSGAKRSRPALDEMMLAVKAGEIERVIVYSFSRFARLTTHLLSALTAFKEKDVRFTSLTEAVDTSSALGMAIYTILGAVSQLERDLISERVRNGLKNARAKGKQIGRKKTRPSAVIRALLKKGMKYREIASIAGCSHGCITAEKREMEKEERERVGLESKDSPTKPSLTLV